jgi:sugar lactone lactonase YvrE
VQVNPDGSWVLPNVPANFGQVRARATCVQNGVTTSGESAFFTVPANGAVNLPDIVLGAATQIPVSLSLTPAPVSFTAASQTTQLTVTATYPDRSVKDVTAASTGTNYTTSNSALLTVGANGLLTAVASGTVVIQATHDGAAGIVTATVVLSSTDTDGDGIPDDVESALGLNPNNPIDAQEDFDRDGLTNLQETLLGTDPRVANTNMDTDGDGIRDILEVQTGSNPLDPNSFNLAQALTSIEVIPASFVLTVNAILGQASRQLVVTGHLRDGTTINLTSTTKGTNYTSSNLAICNFGSQDGRVFAGGDGACTITVTNSGFSATATVTVQTFAPTALSSVSIPGFANNVDVSGNFAYVAAGIAGLQIVDVTDRRAPHIVASLDTTGNANDVQVVGNRAYVADGPAGLQIIDITDPAHPQLLGTLDTPGNAWDVAVAGTRVFIADGSSGLQIIDASTPTAPQPLGAVGTSGTAKGVAVTGNLAVVADGTAGIQVIDVTDPTHPTILASQATGGDARDVVLSGNFAFVADFTRSFTSVDISDPSRPVVRASTPSNTGGLLQDVTLVGRFALGADVFFVNGVPIIDVSNPANPSPVAALDFSTFPDDNGTGIAADTRFVYLTAEQGTMTTENGMMGVTRLYIGQYLVIEDTAGIPPTVSITAPAPNDTIIEGQTILLRAAAMDDIAVAAVSFLVNGQLVFIDTAAPFETSFTVPIGVTSLMIGAQAIDFGGNVSVAQDVVVTVLPDPGTTVVGRIVDPDGHAANGATVICLGVTGHTQADGTFAIPGVPTAQGTIRCTMTFVTPDGDILTGSIAGIPPIVGGTTDVGTIPVVAVYELLVTNLGGNSVRRYDGTTGAFINLFGSGGLSDPEGLAIGPDGNVYVSSFNTNEILRYNGTTGAFMGVFVSAGLGGLGGPEDLVFGPDGNVYVVSYGTHSVLRYNGTTGAFMDTFASGGGLQLPFGLAFGPDGHLYVAGTQSRNILRYNGTTGAFTGEFVPPGSGGLAEPIDVAFGPDGHLYVTSNAVGGKQDGQVLRYDGTTGAFINAFVPAGSGGLSAGRGLAFGPDGNLYVTDLFNDRILRYDGITGASTGVFVPMGSGGLSGPRFLIFHNVGLNQGQ